jgi:hypothetical protein
MVKSVRRSDHRKRAASWAGELGSALTALELLVAPPVGGNVRLRRILQRLRSVVDRLDHLSEDEFIEALEMLEEGSPRRDRSERRRVDLRQLTLGEAEARLRDPATSKEELIALVRERFGGATGTLVRLTKGAVAERLETLIMNERGHETISRLASGESAPALRASSESNALNREIQFGPG